MERSGGRSAHERAEAREARERARIAHEQGIPLEEEQEESPRREGWRPPDLRGMSRYGGSMDVYARRRLVAGLAIFGLIFILFLMLGGC